MKAAIQAAAVAFLLTLLALELGARLLG